MGYIIFIIGVGVLSHFAALISVGTHAVHSTSFENFIHRIILNVCSMVAVTVGFWLIFPQAVSLLIAFNMAFVVSLHFVDFEETYNVFKNEGIR